MEELMIRSCQKRFIQNRFYIKNILEDTIPKRDYYVCSGAMNILTKEEMFLFIENCYIHSKKGFVFNFLKIDSLNNVQYSDVIDFCKTICKTIKIENNYLYNDITVYLKKSLD